MEYDSQEAAGGHKFPSSTYTPYQGTIYNCPDHGPMWIEYSGGAQRYECPVEQCGYLYDPEHDIDPYPEAGHRHPDSPGGSLATGGPVALARDFAPSPSPPAPAPSYRTGRPGPPTDATGRGPHR